MKLKTRTNQPVYYKLPVSSDIEHLSDGLLNSLKVGDVVQKKTGNQKHCYIVTYKGDGAGEGICLSYVACGYMETISYDRSGSSWVFNSKDVCDIESALANVKGFSGDITVKSTYQDYIEAGSIPTSYGLYRLVNTSKSVAGFIFVKYVGNFQLFGLFETRLFSGSCSTSSDFVISNNIVSYGTKFYKHTVKLSGGINTLTFYSNVNFKITDAGMFFNTINSAFNCYYLLNGTEYTVIGIRALGGNSSSGFKFYYLLNGVATEVTDTPQSDTVSPL